jgi:hypothetical protein
MLNALTDALIISHAASLAYILSFLFDINLNINIYPIFSFK